MASETSTKLAERLARILILALERKQFTLQALAQEFDVSVRTLQRDMARLDQVIKLTDKKGEYQLSVLNQDKVYIDKDIYDLIEKLGIDKAIPSKKIEFIRRILKDANESIYYFKQGAIAELNATSRQLIQSLEQSIEKRLEIQLWYKDKFRTVQPYLIVYSNGIWYLAVVENKQIKFFTINKITTIQRTNNPFKMDPAVLDEIKYADSIWSNDKSYHFKIEVSEFAAQYFERRNLLPNQNIVRKEKNKRLIIEGWAANAQQVAPILQYWLGHIKVITPPDLRDMIKNNIEAYLADHPKDE